MAETIIHSVLLFDGDSWYPNSTVVFNSDTGVIVVVYRGSEDASPPLLGNSKVVDGSGYSLLPGLIESHMHAHVWHLPQGQELSLILSSALRCGITTCCDMHSSPEIIDELRRKVEEDKGVREDGTRTVSLADLKSCLCAATIEGGWPKPVVLGPDPSEEQKEYVATWPNVTPDLAADYVAQQKAKGADYIKLMQEDGTCMSIPKGTVPTATLELQAAVVKAAHAQGLVVVGHALSVDNTEVLLKAGVDGLTHTFIDKPLPDSLLELYKKTSSFVIPTLVVLSSLTGEEQQLRERFADIARRNGVVDDFTYRNMTDAFKFANSEAHTSHAYDTLRRLKDEGIDIVAGTDSVAGLQGTAVGPSMWMELDMYVDKCGMSVLQALRSATSVPARRFGFNDRGTIAEGKRADCFLVKGDVSQGLHCLWEKDGIVAVWKEGQRASW